ncbi:MAG: hypothetical protein ACXWMU_02835 [Candidatus Limnocylindrales bacterium]
MSGSDRPTDDEQRDTGAPTGEGDTEGHSLAHVLAVGQLTKRAPRGRRPDEELKPITKRFPSLREDHPKS